MKAQTVLDALEELFPDAHCELEHADNYQMAVAVVLSAQTTDASVNRVTPALFEAYPDAFSLAAAELGDIESCIASLGLYRNKAKAIRGMAQGMVEQYDGEVPSTMEELVRLPGVGRKTANLLLGDLYRVPGSVVVDTHCIRISNRLGLVDNLKEPEKIETALRKILPPESSSDFCHCIVLHGRAVCDARSPQCEKCCVRDLCQAYEQGTVLTKPSKSARSQRTRKE